MRLKQKHVMVKLLIFTIDAKATTTAKTLQQGRKSDFYDKLMTDPHLS